MMKKIILTGLTGLILGCAPIANRELVPTINFGNSREKLQEYRAEFFVGRWEDENRNNHLDEGDYFYAPKTFKGEEMISIVADIEGYKGFLTIRIQSNKTGRIVRTVETEIRGKSLVQYNFTAREMRENSRGGVGEYTIAWHIKNGFDSILIKKQGFEIEK